MGSILLTVLNMSMTASIAILAVCAARLLLKKAPKVISYALWAVVAFRLIMPFSFESMFSLMPINSNPISQDIVYQEAPRIDTGLNGLDNAVNTSLPVPTQDDVISSVNPMQIWLAIGEFIWLIGIAIMVIYSIVTIYLLKRRLKGAVHIRDNIYEAGDLKTPFVLSYINPKIYIPAGLKPEEKNYIILHEQTHIKRKDHLVKLLAYLVLCVHWFNPLVWLAFVLMGADMELSCDERVLRELGSSIKKDYSASLLSFSTGHRIINGSPLAFGEGGVKARIKNVLNFKKPSRIIIIVAVVLAAAVGIGFMANKTGKTDLAEFEAVYSDVTEYSYSVQFKYGGYTYSPYVVNEELQNAGDLRGLKEIGYAVGDKGDKYQIFERAGYATNKFIIVKDDGLMNPAIIYISSAAPEVPNAMRPMLRVDGILYLDTGREVQSKVDNNQIVGTILSSVDASDIPAQNGESNFGSIGAEYAYHEDGIIVRLNDKWFFFEEDQREFLTLADIEKIKEGMTVDEVHSILGASHGMLSGFWGDVYNLDNGHQATIYYDNETETVREILISQSENWVGDQERKIMSLDELRNLASKGSELRFEDFTDYLSINLSSSSYAYIGLVPLNAPYRLIVHADSERKLTNIALEGIWEDGGTGIDIRYDDLEAFINDRPIHMTLKEGTLSPTGATFVLQNLTENEYIYGQPYSLQRKTDGGWVDLKMIIVNYSFTGEGLMLGAKDTQEVVVDWEWLFGALPRGDYRFSKEASFIRAPGDYDTYPLYESFTIDGYVDDPSKLLSSWTPLADLPTYYNAELAIADGVYVSVHGAEAHNQALADAFHSDVLAGIESFMRVLQYTVEGDVIITDYQFDGSMFTVMHDSTRDKFSADKDRIITTATYKYLIPPENDYPDFVRDTY